MAREEERGCFIFSFCSNFTVKTYNMAQLGLICLLHIKICVTIVDFEFKNQLLQFILTDKFYLHCKPFVSLYIFIPTNHRSMVNPLLLCLTRRDKFAAQKCPLEIVDWEQTKLTVTQWRESVASSK